MSRVPPTERQVTPVLGGMRNCATRVVTSILGILAELLGLAHGYYETLQGILSLSRGKILIMQSDFLSQSFGT